MGVLQALVGPVVFYAAVTGPLTFLEVQWPARSMTVRERVNGYKFWLLLVAFEALVVTLIFSGLYALNLKPILIAHSSWGTPILAAIVASLGLDFVFYWFHRAQHRWLWRWHAVHHSIRNLSAINSFHHWSEPAFHAVMVSVPLYFLDVAAEPQNVTIAFLLRAQPYFIHAATRLHLGPLRWLLIDNRYHRIHHSLDPAHHDKNFGAMTPLWDWLFGTLHMPASDENPDVGLVHLPEPVTIVEWSAAPFRLKPPSLAAHSSPPA